MDSKEDIMKCCTLVSKNIKLHTTDQYFYMFRCTDSSGKKSYKKVETSSLSNDKILEVALTKVNSRFCEV